LPAGPNRFWAFKWSLIDNKSTNGLFIGSRRIESAELADGDVIQIGEYELEYRHAGEELAPPVEIAAEKLVPPPRVSPGRRVKSIRDVAAEVVVPGTGVPCPSCADELPAKAKICVKCGIKIDSGRPVLISAGPDEDTVHATSESMIQWVSWVIPFTLLPMPLASEAFGKHKPWAIRVIAAVTFLASLIFLIASFGEGRDTAGKQFMLWPPGGVVNNAISSLSPSEIQEEIDGLNENAREEFEAIKEDLRTTYPKSELDQRAFRILLKRHSKELEEAYASEVGRNGQYHPYQLLTHAFLHDTSSILGFVLHLGGNLLFLLVFGSRVNALLGNIATAIIYPILAIGAAAIYLWLGHPAGPMLGASGAIMGLAGIYLILFPVHRVYCGMWLRIWLRFRTWLFMKVFVLRGFWVLLIYAGYDILMASIGMDSGTAHWAHLGGFFIGASIAMGLLLSRLIYCGGGDLLNVALGKYAWGIIGRPSRWHKQPQVA
jgi:membrane associated rhomboid family serine protease